MEKDNVIHYLEDMSDDAINELSNGRGDDEEDEA